MEDQIAFYCAYALIAEVRATPKPGLVDSHDNGAHNDMTYNTFEKSTSAIVPYLAQMFVTGKTWENKKGEGLFRAIRPIGIEAEEAMFNATDGVNTHKGIIFSMGLICAAAGFYLQTHDRVKAEDVLDLAGKLCYKDLADDFKRIQRKTPETHGEMLFMRYHIKGIRGEAQKGFPSIRQYSLPTLRKEKKAGHEDNQAFLNTLLSLMAHMDDTNVLTRTNHSTLSFAKAEASRIIRMGGASTPEGLHELEKLNKVFIKMNISPGGCADLLAVTILLWRLEEDVPVEA